MAGPDELIARVQAALDPFVKPREQVNYIRRILALHLASYGDGPGVPPLALNESTGPGGVGNELKGVYRDYVEALEANTSARRQFDAELQAVRHDDQTRNEPACHDSDVLDGYLTLLKLQQKRECLLAVQRSLQSLAEVAASRQSLLDTQHVADAAPALPAVPESVVNGMVTEKSTAQPDLHSRVHDAEKALLRACFLLRQEKKLLAESRTRFGNVQGVDVGAKLQALSATRAELIAWIEAELNKASVQDSDGLEDSLGRNQSIHSQSAITTKLHEISQKYAAYVAARREVVDLASTRWQPSISPPHQPSTFSTYADDVDPTPVEHLLAPHVETLLSISKQQKNMVAHKVHSSTVLNKQTRAICQALDRLEEESQLLPSYPMKNPPPQVGGTHNHSFGSPNQRQMSTYAMPWAMAADSAKISTLEAVAEAIEGGQIALEGSMRSLEDIDKLLGRSMANKEHTDGDMSRQQADDPWSCLHGDVDRIDAGSVS
ncbi:hypothetical protein CDD80_6922 [Ophiocordyceps camponoti-rufipedis]|uniref:Uncharacterized protein n=1 Tax=Ophiocordyceps camponoti-rufipedis TaxID=2004952 RepID=A0A2C5ZBL1_9HYPO|nr:hypothetical protein CDD80_6922 [Ophiocordyceps camponoti-rufipedis]